MRRFVEPDPDFVEGPVQQAILSKALNWPSHLHNQIQGSADPGK